MEVENIEQGVLNDEGKKISAFDISGQGGIRLFDIFMPL
jgi:hypothetical protein